MDFFSDELTEGAGRKKQETLSSSFEEKLIEINLADERSDNLVLFATEGVIAEKCSLEIGEQSFFQLSQEAFPEQQEPVTELHILSSP